MDFDSGQIDIDNPNVKLTILFAIVLITFRAGANSSASVANFCKQKLVSAAIQRAKQSQTFKKEYELLIRNSKNSTNKYLPLSDGHPEKDGDLIFYILKDKEEWIRLSAFIMENTFPKKKGNARISIEVNGFNEWPTSNQGEGSAYHYSEYFEFLITNLKRCEFKSLGI